MNDATTAVVDFKPPPFTPYGAMFLVYEKVDGQEVDHVFVWLGNRWSLGPSRVLYPDSKELVGLRLGERCPTLEEVAALKKEIRELQGLYHAAAQARSLADRQVHLLKMTHDPAYRQEHASSEEIEALWRRHGLPSRVVNVLVSARITSPAKLAEAIQPRGDLWIAPGFGKTSRKVVADFLAGQAAPLGDEPITQAEIVRLFGATMPLEAAQMLFNPPQGWAVEQIRARLREIAQAPP